MKWNVAHTEYSALTVTPNTFSPPSTVGQLITYIPILKVLVSSRDDKHSHWPLSPSMIGCQWLPLLAGQNGCVTEVNGLVLRDMAVGHAHLEFE